jgi:hypothetical protein
MTRILVSLLLATTIAYAADQTILGTQLVVKNPGLPEKRSLTGNAKETASSNTLVGDPTVGGATLMVSAEGTTPSQQVFALPQGTSTKGKLFWSGDATKGFKYKDADGDNGAVKQAQIKKSPKGVFTIKFKATGKTGTVSVLPPNDGDGGCILLALSGGDSYNVRFAPGDGEVSNKGATLFKVKKPTSEGTCITSTSGTTSSTTSTTNTTTTTTGGSTSTTIFAGPDFPPTGGNVQYNFTGNSLAAGGSQLSFFNFTPTTWTALYWGSWTAPSNPTAGLDGSQHNLAFVGISGGGTVATWQGTSPWTNPGDMMLYMVPIQLTITLVTPPAGVVWVDSTTVTGLDPGAGTGIGAAVNVAPAGTAQSFTAQFEFKADVPTDDPTGFIPLGSVPTTGGGQTVSSFSGGFYSQP